MTNTGQKNRVKTPQSVSNAPLGDLKSLKQRTLGCAGSRAGRRTPRVPAVALSLEHTRRFIFAVLTKRRFRGADAQHSPLTPVTALRSHPLPAVRNSHAALAPGAPGAPAQPPDPSPPGPWLFPTALPSPSLPQLGVFLCLPSSTSSLPVLLPPPVCLPTPPAELGSEFREPGRCKTTYGGAAGTLLRSSGQPKETKERETKVPAAVSRCWPGQPRPREAGIQPAQELIPLDSGCF